MADIVGAVNEFARLDDPLVIYAKGRGRDTGSLSDTQLETVVGAVGLTTGYTFPARYRQDAYASLVYELVDVDRRNAGRMGLVNPEEVVWELLPYSFVVDWALPIGPWLSALRADEGLKFKAGSLATVRVCSETGPASGAESYFGQSLPDLGIRLSSKCFERTVYQSPPVPGLYVKNPLSIMHGLNGLALLISAFR